MHKIQVFLSVKKYGKLVIFIYDDENRIVIDLFEQIIKR
jgi:hypothetical protein